MRPRWDNLNANETMLCGLCYCFIETDMSAHIFPLHRSEIMILGDLFAPQKSICGAEKIMAVSAWRKPLGLDPSLLI